MENLSEYILDAPLITENWLQNTEEYSTWLQVSER